MAVCWIFTDYFLRFLRNPLTFFRLRLIIHASTYKAPARRQNTTAEGIETVKTGRSSHIDKITTAIMMMAITVSMLKTEFIICLKKFFMILIVYLLIFMLHSSTQTFQLISLLLLHMLQYYGN